MATLHRRFLGSRLTHSFSLIEMRSHVITLKLTRVFSFLNILSTDHSLGELFGPKWASSWSLIGMVAPLQTSIFLSLVILLMTWWILLLKEVLLLKYYWLHSLGFYSFVVHPCIYALEKTLDIFVSWIFVESKCDKFETTKDSCFILFLAGSCNIASASCKWFYLKIKSYEL